MVVVVAADEAVTVVRLEDEGERDDNDVDTGKSDITLLSTSSSEELSIELLSMNPESLSSSSSIKSSCSSMESSSDSVKATSSCVCWRAAAAVGAEDDDDDDDDEEEESCSSSGSRVDASDASEESTGVVSSHSMAGVEAWAWVRAGWCNTSSAQRAWGGDVQITLVGTSSALPSPDHRRLPLARGSPIVKCPLFCSDISAHMML